METVKTIDGRPMLRLPFPEFPGAFFIMSFKYERVSMEHIGYHIKYREPFFPCDPFVTFFYGGEIQGAEWEPNHGPIMLYRKCDPSWTGETLSAAPLTAKRHWYYDWVEDNALAWSQLAVDREGLKPMLKDGDFNGIFSVLKRWALPEDAM